jgi:hypothetical protein
VVSIIIQHARWPEFDEARCSDLGHRAIITTAPGSARAYSFCATANTRNLVGLLVLPLRSACTMVDGR